LQILFMMMGAAIAVLPPMMILFMLPSSPSSKAKKRAKDIKSFIKSAMIAIVKLYESSTSFCLSIFFTGDLVNYKTGEAYRFENILNKLKAGYGIFATLGNHDYGDYTRWPSQTAKMKNLTDLYEFFDRLGWKLLNNEHHLLENEDGQLAVIGVENWGAYSRFPKYGDIEKAAAGTEDAAVKLLLSHDPTHWDVVISKKYPDIDVTFAGHTHGFQFGIDTRRVKWSPAQWVYKHWAGMYQNPAATEKPQYLYVNRGLGTIGYPGRVGILPEITLFELLTA